MRREYPAKGTQRAAVPSVICCLPPYPDAERRGGGEGDLFFITMHTHTINHSDKKLSNNPSLLPQTYACRSKLTHTVKQHDGICTPLYTHLDLLLCLEVLVVGSVRDVHLSEYLEDSTTLLHSRQLAKCVCVWACECVCVRVCAYAINTNYNQTMYALSVMNGITETRTSYNKTLQTLLKTVIPIHWTPVHFYS